MWLVMRGALTSKVRKVHQSYCLPSMTATATVVYEDLAEDAEGETPEGPSRKSCREFEGVLRDRRLISVYVRVQHAGLSSQQVSTRHHRARAAGPVPIRSGRLIREGRPDRRREGHAQALDWRALIRYGVIFFILEKLGAAVGVPNNRSMPPCAGVSRGLSKDTQNAGAVLRGGKS